MHAKWYLIDHLCNKNCIALFINKNYVLYSPKHIYDFSKTIIY